MSKSDRAIITEQCAELEQLKAEKASNVVIIASLREEVERLKGTEQTKGESSCKEDDGCPTEKAVLQREWRSMKDDLHKLMSAGPTLYGENQALRTRLEQAEVEVERLADVKTLIQEYPLTAAGMVQLSARCEAAEWKVDAIMKALNGEHLTLEAIHKLEEILK